MSRLAVVSSTKLSENSVAEPVDSSSSTGAACSVWGTWTLTASAKPKLPAPLPWPPADAKPLPMNATARAHTQASTTKRTARPFIAMLC